MEQKYRNEIKYVCTEAQLQMLEHRISAYCRKDPHAGDRGIYQIRSVYFDDLNNTCFYDNENGVNNREKFRIRIYNANTDYISLECKKKRNGLNHKDNCLLTEELCRAILDGCFDYSMVEGYEPAKGDVQLLKKFYLQYRTRLLRPKVIVSYDRTPYIYSAGNVRITFDRNISGSAEVSRFLEPVVNGRPIMPTGMHVLEVKYDELLPDFLKNAMQLGTLTRTTYSKYYQCRRFL